MAPIMSGAQGPLDRAPLHPEAWLEEPFRFDTLLELVKRVKRYVIAEGSGRLAMER